ncbi:MAG: protein phosphatase CheZ [Pseudomonadota bacterium]
MRQTARIFRIERNGSEASFEPVGETALVPNDDVAAARHAEIIGLLKTLQTSGVQAEDKAAPQNEFFDQYKRELAEAMKLKAELDSIYEAIAETKQEIASLHHSAIEGKDMHRVTDELDAIVGGTELATESILAAAEAVDENANTLSAMLDGDSQGLAIDIQDNTVKIFEACNFQDLTGQRITKVINALRFIEERVNSMMDIWGGIDSFSEVEPIMPPEKEGDKALLNGPAIDGEEGIASQDDIDALFD